MQQKKMYVFMIAAGIFLALVPWLFTAKPVSAQCGSQASTCKDCHEVQGQLSVNADGTGWHESHAFGDFCYMCHAGNQQATEIDAAHTGMVPPLSDTKAACQQCHPKDLDARVKVYADILGVDAGAGAAPAAVSQTVVTICEPTADVPEDKTVILAKPAEPVDYVANYNKNVLGIKPVDWSLIGLVSLIVVVLIGGVGFVAIKTGFVVVTFERPVKAKAVEEPKEEPKA